MNSWKVVWNAYYEQATRTAYAKELVRLASWPTRTCFVLALILFLFGAAEAMKQPHENFPWKFILGELALIALVKHVRTTAFATAYGSIESDLGPPEKEEQRGYRFLIFKDALRSQHVTPTHVRDLFEIVQAKEELESQHNIALGKFGLFATGFLTSAAVTVIRGLQPTQAALLLFWFALASMVLAPLFWILPTRKGKLKELKYFMVLYCRNPD